MNKVYFSAIKRNHLESSGGVVHVKTNTTKYYGRSFEGAVRE
jgi:hypothetical protein